MIAGIIILSVFLTAFVAMVIISQEYDVYQNTLHKVEQKEIDRYSENLMGAYPGIINGTEIQVDPARCGGVTCNNYTILLNNLGIGTQIARIYINSSQAPGCVGLCVLDPAAPPSGYGLPYRFRASDGYVNAGESFHNVVVWLPSDIRLTKTCGASSTGCHTVKIVTIRGSIFLFLYPFPILGAGIGGGEGGTGIYIGPLVITFQKNLVTYTNSIISSPPLPIGGTNGYWVIPSGALVLYVKIQTDAKAKNDVYLTAQSVFEIMRFDSPGSVNYFYVIAPISLTLCDDFHNKDPTIICDTTYGYNSNGNNGNPAQIAPYRACQDDSFNPPKQVPPQQYNTQTCNNPPYNDGPRYLIPQPSPAQRQLKQRGNPVIVAFAVNKPSGTNPQKIQGGNPPSGWNTLSVTSFLGLSFVYDDGAGAYIYGVTLPFIAMCVNSAGNTCSV